MRYGDKIKWQYTHHLNSKSRVEKVKGGIFQGLTKHTARHKGNHQMALVLFDTNKGCSSVPLDELYFCGGGK